MKNKIISLFLLLLLVLLSFSSCIALRSADSLPSYDRTTGETDSSEKEADDLFIEYAPNVSDTLDKADESEKEQLLETPLLPYEGVNISLLAVGDNLIHPNIYTDAYNRGNAEKRYDFLPMYSDVADMIAAADIAFINQETVMAGDDFGISGYPCFNSPRQLGDDVVSLGFDVINIANNHMLDMGTTGLGNTIEFWNSKPVTLIGGYLDEEDYGLRVTECEGITIGWLSYTYATNGIVKSPSSPIVIPYIDDNLIVSDIEKYKDTVDFLIVSMHWGDENTQTPNHEQERLAKLIADTGADLIIGHHSHTVQPIEWIETERGKILCIYSLGNFVSGMQNSVNMVGGLLTLDIKSDGKGGLEVGNVLFTPTLFWFDWNWNNTHLYLLDRYTDELSYSHHNYNGGALSVDGARAFITNTIAPEFLPDYLK